MADMSESIRHCFFLSLARRSRAWRCGRRGGASAFAATSAAPKIPCGECDYWCHFVWGGLWMIRNAPRRWLRETAPFKPDGSLTDELTPLGRWHQLHPPPTCAAFQPSSPLGGGVLTTYSREGGSHGQPARPALASSKEPF